MKSGGLHKQYDHSKKMKSVLYYQGAVTHEILGNLTEILKGRIANEKRKNKILNVFVEMAQNVSHYSSEKEKDYGVGLILVKEKAHILKLSTANFLTPETAAPLREKLDHFLSLTGEEVKELYQEKIKGERPEDSKGAGLGFLEILKKSDFPFRSSFEETSDGEVFFTLTVFFRLG
ncbi:SiaB family protein kinase [Leptospira sp. 201903071]|uniref:SiaB family protein kinase n=1 Tax=Leptospira ainazelensis TaxID=2810034 RepID=UPI00196461E7|nr:SiaB family protein kinase [Leptospira ainazelensis]MBM9502523.1 SiaB family protein kinase [Leptospira ainazelensis]